MNATPHLFSEYQIRNHLLFPLICSERSRFPEPAVDNKSLVGDLLKGDQVAVLAGGR